MRKENSSPNFVEMEHGLVGAAAEDVVAHETEGFRQPDFREALVPCEGEGLDASDTGVGEVHGLENIFASSFMYDPNGVACWPAVVLNYTSKTQFLFRINKGCEDISDNKMINEYKPLNERPMPFTNMIYIGDGDTDVPCMKMIKAQGGHSIAVYKPSKGAKDRAQHLIRDDRVNVILPADYSEGKPIERFIKAIIDKIAADSAITRFKL